MIGCMSQPLIFTMDKRCKPIAQEIIDRCLRLQAEEPVDMASLA